mmetsp:Transcript_53973/g.80523  ORF Transcript_53973/g.80523 Transcript_53973/m.80523 type:complete len:89 (+) Transcript_53973:231-497(+)
MNEAAKQSNFHWDDAAEGTGAPPLIATSSATGLPKLGGIATGWAGEAAPPLPSIGVVGSNLCAFGVTESCHQAVPRITAQNRDFPTAK